MIAHSSLELRSSLLKIISSFPEISMVVLSQGVEDALSNLQRHEPEIIVFEFCLKQDCYRFLQKLNQLKVNSRLIALTPAPLDREIQTKYDGQLDFVIDPANDIELLRVLLEKAIQSVKKNRKREEP